VGSGYTRGIEVQVLVNLTYKNKKGEITATSQGDLFSIWGATCVPDRPHPEGWARCLPSENHCKGENEWNHYRVEAKDGRITLAVNGHVVSGLSKCKPRKGYLALESEGSECRFRNLKIKELPSTNPKKEEIADVAQGHKNLFFGDLSGWKADEETKKHWQPKDFVLHCDGKGKELRTEWEFGDGEFLVDFKFPAKKEAGCTFVFREGKEEVNLSVTSDGKIVALAPGFRYTLESKEAKPAGQWNRLRAALKGDDVEVAINGKGVLKLSASHLPAKSALVLRPKGAMAFANLFVRELK